MKNRIHAAHRDLETRSTRLDALLGRLIAGGVVAGAAAFALAPPVEARQDDEAMEYEPDEGLHEEEWYDPSDWFDDDDATDYEGESDAAVLYDPYVYPVDYTGYWDGYYDGYYDTAFGYDDWDATWSGAYRTTYTDGYFDGYYDRLNAYAYDPYWYTVGVFDREADGPSEDAKKRGADEKRSRGDRAAPADDSASGSDRAEGERRERAKRRVRGQVASIEATEDGAMGSHAVMRVAFEDREAVVADFGPKMSASEMPVESGDRITLVGRRSERDGTKVLTVHEIVAGDETYRIRGPKGEMDDDASAKAQSSGEPSESADSADD